LQVDGLKDKKLTNKHEMVGMSHEYQESLIHYLQETLNLPEYGEVKIEVTLRQDGSVAHMVVVKAESEKNRKYLEAHLPKLKFPRLDEPFSSKKQHTFVLTFCNEV
jgi:hypothetical protein